MWCNWEVACEVNCIAGKSRGGAEYSSDPAWGVVWGGVELFGGEGPEMNWWEARDLGSGFFQSPSLIELAIPLHGLEARVTTNASGKRSLD